MNTYNALGYFLGALSTPALMRRAGVWRLLGTGAIAASVIMLAAGFTTDTVLLAVQRLGAGIASALSSSRAACWRPGSAHNTAAERD